jgi:hypothetical protein
LGREYSLIEIGWQLTRQRDENGQIDISSLFFYAGCGCLTP